MIQDTEDRPLGISRLHDEYYKRNRATTGKTFLRVISWGQVFEARLA